MSLPLICLKVGEKAYMEGLSKGMSKRFVFERKKSKHWLGGCEGVRLVLQSKIRFHVDSPFDFTLISPCCTSLNDFGGGEEIRKENERKEKKQEAKVMVDVILFRF